MIHLRFPRIAMLVLVLALASSALCAQEVTVMTYNVLCSFCDRANYDPWEDRLNYHQDIVTRHAPDLIGLQEISKGTEVAQIAAHLTDFEPIYFKEEKDGQKKDYPDAAIFYRRSMFEVIEQGTYWLGDTPDKPWSRGWAKGQFWRIAMWAHFKFKEGGREFYFISTHFDNNTPNQANSAPLILRKVEPWAAKMPCIVLGDFNSKPDSVAYGTLTKGIDGQGFHLNDVRDAAPEKKIVTNQSPEPVYDPAGRIDHIFTAGMPEPKSLRWAVDMTQYGTRNRYPSDHLAISARLKIE